MRAESFIAAKSLKLKTQPTPPDLSTSTAPTSPFFKIQGSDLKVLKVLDKNLGEVVSRGGFLNLSTVVAELAHGQSCMQETLTQLGEAQRRTEARFGVLAEAQKRAEERVEELAKAQWRTEPGVEGLAQPQKRTEQRVEELAEAQKRTEETMLRGLKELRDLITALGSRWGLQTEEVFRETVKNLIAFDMVRSTIGLEGPGLIPRRRS